MDKIFISYRRADTTDIAGRLYDRLVARYGRDRIFKDVDTILPGMDFSDFIHRSIAESAMSLVLIGDGWLSAQAGGRRRRLDDPTDFVRQEIETSLRLGVPLVALLVDDANAPEPARLPPSLRPLADFPRLPLRSDSRFDADLGQVYLAIDDACSRPRPTIAPPVTPTPTAAASEGQGDESRASAPRMTLSPGWARRRARPLALVAALIAIAIAASLLLPGVISGNIEAANARATEVASEATLHAEATSLAQLVDQPYKPAGVGPCDTADGYWKWADVATVTCVGGATTRLVAGVSSLTFNGVTGAFPSAFDVSMRVSMTEQSGLTCVDIVLRSGNTPSGVTGTSSGYQICDNGAIYSLSSDLSSYTYQVSSPSSRPALFAIALHVSPQSLALDVNGQSVASIAPPVGSVGELAIDYPLSGNSALGVMMSSTGEVDISGFSLTPRA